MKILFLIVLSHIYSHTFSQYHEDSINFQQNNFELDRDAKFAVFKIVQYNGLIPNYIIIQDETIKNAVAYVKNRKRYIKYNPNFMKRITDSTQTDWAAISVLAHEIGHHLLGHTLANNESNPGDELSADRYSGFILFQMGATLEESLRCIESEGNLHGTKTHPPREARIEAITDGWHEAVTLIKDKMNRFSYPESTEKEKFKYQCAFVGDDNTYYVNEKLQMVWYDNYANPIVIGVLKESTDKSYKWNYHYDKSLYGIDNGGTVWLLTSHGSVMEVGQMKDL